MLVHPCLSLSSFPATRRPQSSSSLCPSQCSSSLPFWFLPLSPHPHQIYGTNRPGICAATAAGGGGREVDTFTANSGYLFELSDSDADSLAGYSISKIGAIYRRKPLIVMRRLFQIGTTFGKWFGLRFIDRLMERCDEIFEVRAAELRKILTELGPERSSYPTKRPSNCRSRILQCCAGTVFSTQDAMATSSMASFDLNMVSNTLKPAAAEITHALPLENFNLRLVLADLDPATAKLAIGFLGPFLSVFGFLFILRIVMSWYPKLPVGKFPYVIAYAPTEPLLVQTRKVIPPLAGVDVTPVVWFGLLSFLNEILVGPQGLLVLLSQQVN